MYTTISRLFTKSKEWAFYKMLHFWVLRLLFYHQLYKTSIFNIWIHRVIIHNSLVPDIKMNLTKNITQNMTDWNGQTW